LKKAFEAVRAAGFPGAKISVERQRAAGYPNLKKAQEAQRAAGFPGLMQYHEDATMLSCSAISRQRTSAN